MEEMSHKTPSSVYNSLFTQTHHSVSTQTLTRLHIVAKQQRPMMQCISSILLANEWVYQMLKSLHPSQLDYTEFFSK